jgi:outer membrane receptor for ferrienterochelin and colicins
MRRVMGRHAALFLAAVGIVAGGVELRAQNEADLTDLSLEDLMRVRVGRVFGAARRVQPATEAPSAVTIVTADDIARYGYRTLADILRSVRGLFVTYDRHYSYLGARGFARPGDYNTRILLLVDGHRMNDDVFDQASLGRELGLDPLTFQRVEIIRGPASALYGTSAFFAVVNVTTKRGADLNGAAVNVEAGSLGSRRVHGAIGRTFANGLDLAFSGNAEGLDGQNDLFFPEFETNGSDGIARNVDGESVRAITGRLGFRNLTISGAYSWREKTVPTAAFDTVFNDPRFKTVDERAFIDAAFDRDLGRTRLAVRGYADMYRYDGEYPYEAEDGSGSLFSTDYGHGAWWGAEARATRTVAVNHTLTAGIELREYATQAQGESYPDEPTFDWAADASTGVFAAYVQDEVRVHDRWLVTLGGRYDAYSGFDRFSPRAGVVFMATPMRAFKYLFGSAFRAPNAYEFDYLTQGVRNDALGAETITTNEFVWEEYTGEWMRNSVSVYRSEADRLISLITDDEGFLAYANAGRVVARGLELETEVRRGGVQALASYAWQTTEDRDTGDRLTNSPAHLGKFRLGMAGPTAGSTLGIELQAMSRRTTMLGDAVDGFTVANLTYLHPLGRGVAFTATVKNLFDADYADPASEEHRQRAIPRDGRTAHVGVRWTWSR